MITPERRADLDKLRHDWGLARYKHVKRRLIPPNRWADGLEYEKTYRRMGHLAEHLALLQIQYHGAREIYCDRLLADLSNVLIRKWPDIELGNDLKSVAAAATMPETKIIPEHDSPISFFRDVILGPKMLTVDDWKYLLATCLRVKTIVSNENKRLNKKKWKQNRPVDAYRHPDVDIPLTEHSQGIERGFRFLIDRWHGTEGP